MHETVARRARGIVGFAGLLVFAAACANSAPAGPNPGSDMTATGGHCLSDSECPSGLHCDDTTHACYACVLDSQCPPGSVCTTVTHTCIMGCSQQNPNCGDAGVCDTTQGKCVQCVADGDCPTSNPLCDPVSHTCNPCLPSKDDCGHGMYCSTQVSGFACAPGCKDDSDCSESVDGGSKDMAGSSPASCDTTTHQCVQCSKDGDCPLGLVCSGHSCSPGCTSTHGCPGGLACCNATCVDLSKDAGNCGACNNVCSGGACCNSKCANIASDVMNCGGCGMACSFAHATPACLNRVCAIGMCDPGWADCNGQKADGCEVNIDTSVANCGGCGNACSLPNATAKCVGGMCAVAACSFAFADCNGNPVDGCETNIQQDASNCGACGAKCSLPNATPKCVAGTCAIAACMPGYVDCNAQPNDGCEANTQSDPKNCGGCYMACSTTNDTPTCVSSTCQLACTSGWGNCDNIASNGCETNLNTDAGHCGSCSTSCTAPANVQSTTCSSATCAIASCKSGYYDLDMTYGNGCECQADSYGASCTGASPGGTLGIGASTTITGNLVPSGTENWFSFTFTGNTNKSYHPSVTLSTNPGGAFVIDVFSSCGAAVPCGEGGTCTGMTTWEVYYTGGDPNSAFNPIPPVGNNGTVIVRVRRASGSVTCDNYVLTVSN